MNGWCQTPSKKLKSPVRYYGGKLRGLDKILSFFPSDIRNYVFVDLFGGSFVVSLNVSSKRIVYNDLNEELTDFWKAIRGYADENGDYPLYELFKSELKTMIMSPDYMKYLGDLRGSVQDPARKIALNAAYFYARNLISWSGSDRMTVATMPGGQVLRDHFDEWHRWFVGKHVRIWNLDFREVMKRIEKTDRKVFIYADPPYYEMGFGYKHNFTEQDHEDLADLLHKTKHKWVLSYDDHPRVRELYKDCDIHEVQWWYSGAPNLRTNGKHELVIVKHED